MCREHRKPGLPGIDGVFIFGFVAVPLGLAIPPGQNDHGFSRQHRQHQSAKFRTGREVEGRLAND
jgi:hypothetical protein